MLTDRVELGEKRLRVRFRERLPGRTHCIISEVSTLVGT
jgi:hypothetical protein